ncbi:MAG: YitT family protein [Bacillaceae bacterium]
MLRWKTLKTFLMINIGSFILAASYYHIHTYNELTEGGFLGITLILKHLFDISPAITNLLLDIPMIIVGIFLLGRMQALNIFIGASAYSVYYWLVENYSPFTIDLHDHMIFAAILGGVLVGGGLGIILKFGGGTGGDDILAIVLAKVTSLSIGTVFFILDCVVLVMSLVYLDIIQVAYALLTVAVSGKVLDMIYYSGNQEAKAEAKPATVSTVTTKVKPIASKVSDAVTAKKPETAAFKSTKPIQVTYGK